VGGVSPWLTFRVVPGVVQTFGFAAGMLSALSHPAAATQNMSKKIVQPDQPTSHLVIFQERAIRRLWQDGAWWFSVVDVCGVLTDSPDAGAYWRKLKQRLVAEGSEVVTFCHGLKLEAPDGKQRATDCADTEGLFRIIQSIPSPKAEPFKRWLAQIGYERVKEIENPELASARARELYQAKGYPQAWIEKRLRSIAVRGELTDEWKARGVEEGKEYSILTAEIARATFGVTPGTHRRLKGLDKVKTGNNLRDHMTDLELIFTMLGEASTTEIARRKDAQGFAGNRYAAKEGGAVAGNARKELEAKSGKPVVSRANYLALSSAQPAADALSGRKPKKSSTAPATKTGPKARKRSVPE
jgi:DNA-damage-inducible protein D